MDCLNRVLSKFRLLESENIPILFTMRTLRLHCTMEKAASDYYCSAGGRRMVLLRRSLGAGAETWIGQMV